MIINVNDMVSLSEMSELLGESPKNLLDMSNIYENFPKPVKEIKLYDRNDILNWYIHKDDKSELQVKFEKIVNNFIDSIKNGEDQNKMV